MSDMPARERRREPRVKSVNLVSIARFSEEGFQSDLGAGMTLNLSTGGLRIELNHPLPLRSTVSLSLALGSEIVDVDGTVCYLETVGDTRCQMGLKFVNLSLVAQETIRRYLENRGNHP